MTLLRQQLGLETEEERREREERERQERSDPDRARAESRRRLGQVGDALTALLSGPGAFVTDVGAGLAGLGNLALPGRPFEGIQDALSERSQEISRIGFEANPFLSIPSRLGTEVLGIATTGALLKGPQAVSGAARATTPISRGARALGLAEDVGTGARLTGRGALLQSVPLASIQAAGSPEASTAGAIASITPESQVGRVAADVAEDPLLRIASEAGLDLGLGVALEGIGRGVRALRGGTDVTPTRSATGPTTRREARQRLAAYVGEDAPLMGRTRRPPGVHDPEGYAVQFTKFGATDEIQQKIFQHYNAMLEAGAIPAKVRVSAEETLDAARQFGFDDIKKGWITKRLDDVMLASIRVNYADNFGKLENAVRQMSRIMDELDAPVPPANAPMLRRTLDQLELSVARFEAENDFYLRAFVEGASQRGRDLASLRHQASGSSDPIYWRYKLNRVMGGRDFLPEEEVLFRDAIGELRGGNILPMMELAEQVAPKIELFRGPIQAIALPSAGVLIGAGVSPDNPVAGAVIGGTIGFNAALTGDAFVQLRRAGLLTGGRTQARNFLSNAMEGFLRHAESPAAAMADRLANNYAGHLARDIGRTRLFQPVARFEAGAGGAMRGIRKMVNVIRGKDVLESGLEADTAWMAKLDLLRNGAATFNNRLADSYTGFIFRLQGAADAPFRFAAFWESIQEQATILAKGDGAARQALIDQPLDDMVITAIRDAEEATFRSQNFLSNAVGQADRVIQTAADAGNLGAKAAGVGLGFTVPFRRTPANVLFRIFERAPITSWVNVAGKFGEFRQLLKAADIDITELRRAQRAFSTAAGRSAGGTALAALVGFRLAEAGLMSGALPDDSTERQKWQQQGKTPESVMIGGRWRRLTGISPIGNIIAIGAQIYHDLHDPELETPGQRIWSGAATGARAFMEQSFLRGPREVIEAIEGGGGTATQRAVGAMAGSVVPTAVADVAAAMDPTLRESTGVVKGIGSRIPGVRQTLPARQDVFGEDIQLTDTPGQAAARLVDPFLSRSPPEGFVDQVLIDNDLRVPTTRIGATVSNLDETPEEFSRRNRVEGRELRRALADMFRGDRWRRLPREDRQEAVRSLSTSVRRYIRSNDLNAKDSWGLEISRALRNAEGN